MKPELVPPPDQRTAPAATEPVVPVVRMSVDARGLALAVLAVIAVVFALDWAQTFVISLLLGILIAYALNPLVVWLERIRVPRTVASLIVMLGVMGSLGVRHLVAARRDADDRRAIARGGEQVLDGAGAAADQSGRRHAKDAKRRDRSREGDRAGGRGSAIAKQPATHVVIDQPMFKLGDFLWVGSKGALGAMGQAIMVLFLTFFLLVGGDMFKRKLVRLTGPSLSNRKITVQILDDINDSIQKYLFMLLSTNVLVGLLVWAAFAWIGLENAGAWAVAAGFLHVVPYIGPGVTAAATGMAAFMQFDSFSMAVLVAGVSMAIATVVGTFVTTWMTGRIARMNAAAIFISLLFWGWLWGIWGMLLGIPIIVIVKVVSQHVEQLQPVAELLGE